MKDTDTFFKKIYSSPSLIWKAGAGFIFLGLALGILFFPNLTNNIDSDMRIAFAGLLIFYSLYRFATFYFEYKRKNDE